MERPIFKPVGTPAEELDTPALVVDLDALDHNIATAQAAFDGSAARLRPHLAAHGCPAIAHRQTDSPGISGVAVATVGQAEALAQAGFRDVLLTSYVVTPPKVSRVCALARSVRVILPVESAENVRQLSEAATAFGVTLDLVVEVNLVTERWGVPPGPEVVELARVISAAPGVRLVGLHGYEGLVQEPDVDERARICSRHIQRVLDCREDMEKAGLPVEMVAVGGTHSYDVACQMDGVTDVLAGSYALMDLRYAPLRPELRPAARVLAVVSSRPEEAVAILDAGRKAIGDDEGPPAVDGRPGATVARLSAEHAILSLEGEARQGFDLGERVWLLPYSVGTCANLYDYVHAIHNGHLEAVWGIPARGRYR